MFSLLVDKNIQLRLLEETHAEELYLLTDQNREHLRKWLSWVDKVVSVQDTRNFIKLSLKQFEANKGIQAGIWYKEMLVGVIGCETDPEDKTATIGYWLAAPFQSHGIMTKACRALIEYLFREKAMNRIEIRCAVENKRSRAIPERLGFTQEGVIRNAELLNGRYVDHVIYGLHRKDWKPKGQL
jgi:ribosomal-protein-serine acetyltransferase